MTGRPPIPPRVWQLDAASLSDANKALRVLPRELRPYTRGIRMVGRAVTVAASGDLVPVLAGLEQCGAGDVLVVDAGTTEQAVLGELFATEAMRREMAGIVVYGLCRDTATLAQLPLPIYALGTIPRAAGATALPVTQQPVRLGDVEVHPGDILLGRRRRHRGSQRRGAGRGPGNCRSDSATRRHDPFRHPRRQIIVRAAELRRAP